MVGLRGLWHNAPILWLRLCSIATTLVSVSLSFLLHCVPQQYILVAGVAHLGLSPHTIHVTSSFGAVTVKLGGFASSQVHKGRGRLSRTLELSAYSAPEVKAQKYTWTADMWSLGVVLYCLLAGFLPIPEGVFNFTYSDKG